MITDLLSPLKICHVVLVLDSAHFPYVGSEFILNPEMSYICVFQSTDVLSLKHVFGGLCVNCEARSRAHNNDTILSDSDAPNDAARKPL